MGKLQQVKMRSDKGIEQNEEKCDGVENLIGDSLNYYYMKCA